MATANRYLLIWYIIYDSTVRHIVKDSGGQRPFSKVASSAL